MNKLTVAIFCCLSAVALAGEKAKPDPKSPSAMKFTPRTVTNEDKKGIEDLMAAEESAMMKNDMEACASMVDFPIYMVTDNAKGEVSASTWDKKKYLEVMSASAAAMPKDLKTKHDRKYVFLTDTMAVVEDNVSGTAGKEKWAWKNAGLVVKKDGKWMWKSMMEGGWGDMPADSKGGSMSGSH